MPRKAHPSTDSSAISAPAPATAQQMGCLALVARMTWLVFGNLALIATALWVFDEKGLTAADGIFWGIAFGLAGVRYLDVTRFGGFTSDGKPATVADWRRYALKLAVASVAMWGAAHLLGGALP